MSKRITSMPGFWRSVFSLALAFVVLFLIVKSAIEGFSFEFLTRSNPYLFVAGLIGAGFVYGFFVTYGKYRKKARENQTD